MSNKKFIIALVMLFIAVGAISSVSASDLNATDDVAMENAPQTIEENTVLKENTADESLILQNSADVYASDESNTSQEVENTMVVDNKLSLSASKLTTTYGNNKYFKVKVVDSQKNPVQGISLTLKIYTGKKYKTVKLVTGYDSDEKKNGVAGILTNKYSVGTHKVKITPTSGNYKGSATAKIVITKVAKKNYYNFHIYFTKGKIVSKVFK